MENLRTKLADIDFSNHKLEVKEDKLTTIHRLIHPGYDVMFRVNFINVMDRLWVTGDFGDIIMHEKTLVENSFPCAKPEESNPNANGVWIYKRDEEKLEKLIDEGLVGKELRGMLRIGNQEMVDKIIEKIRNTPINEKKIKGETMVKITKKCQKCNKTIITNQITLNDEIPEVNIDELIGLGIDCNHCGAHIMLHEELLED